MTSDDVRTIVLSAHQDALAGRQAEHPKLELKRAWWGLSQMEEQEEFAKDLAMLANAPGGHGFIVIGIDAKTGQLFDNPVSSTGLDDADIQQKSRSLITPMVDWHVMDLDVNGHTISVIVIPSSKNRPHIVRRHGQRENCIPVRKGTGYIFASRSDLDEMYNDRVGSREVMQPFWDQMIFDGGGFRLRCLLAAANQPILVSQGSLTLRHGDKTLGPYTLSRQSIAGERLQVPPNATRNDELEFPAEGQYGEHRNWIFGQRLLGELRLELRGRDPVTLNGEVMLGH